MQVLQVTHGALWGGGERHILSLFEAFQGHPEIHQSLCVFTDGRLAAEARRLGVPVHVIPKGFRGDPRPFWNLVRLIQRLPADVVHTHLLSGNMYGRLAARLARIPLITTLHYIDREALPFLSRFNTWLLFDGDIWFSRLCDRIIATSEDMRGKLIARGLRAERIVTILNGINLAAARVPEGTRERERAALGFAPEAPVIGLVGRLVPVKNVGLFLEMAKQVLGEVPQARFVVVGDGPLRAELEQTAARLGIADRVIFAGFRVQVWEAIAMFDIAVLCSNSETSAYGVSENMAMGLPVVATAVGGIPELLRDGETGRICPPRDARALAEAVLELVRRPAEARRLGVAARRHVVQALSLEAMAEQLASVYNSVRRG